jgi:predicted peptidase
VKKLAFLLALCLPLFGQAQLSQVYQEDSFYCEGRYLPYRVSPAPIAQAPILLFLHGSGERGSDNAKQLVHGASPLATLADSFCIIIPQCPEDDYWSSVIKSVDEQGGRHFSFESELEPTWAMRALTGLLDSLMEADDFNANRSVIGGLSMGGMGTFELVSRRPQYFHKAFPICGGGDPDIAPLAYQTEWWIFHGLKDDIVDPEFSKAMHQAFLENGVQSTLTLYPEANHNSWDSCFAEPTLYSWIRN